MKCVICELKKAKRFCPAKNGLICPLCCGEKRILEIACPESCEYLRASREREAEAYARLLRTLDSRAQERTHRVLQNYPHVIGRLEYALSRARFLSRDLTDPQVVQAAGLLLENYRTEEKGILYEKTSEDLRVESLRRELRGILESFRNPSRNEDAAVVDPQISRLPLSAAVDCLEFIRTLAEAFMRERASDAAYVDFLARFYPREETRSSIVMPKGKP